MSILLINANALSIPLADESVHMCVTSPPYWSLRDYNVDGQLGMEPLHDCLGWATGDVCGLCYVCQMVLVFRELWRVLRPDGTAWLNLGDSYAGGNGNGGSGPASSKQVSNRGSYFGPVSKSKRMERGSGRWGGGNSPASGALKPKDLVGIPWRVAFALQADGWYLRSDIIWSKPNPMPESVTDRPTKAHEYLFLLTKSASYYYDADAVREPLLSTPEEYLRAGKSVRENHAYGEVAGRPLGPSSFLTVPSGRNKRTVWNIATAPYSGAHFATFPPALVEPCIKAGTSAHGVCSECGAPYRRIVERDTHSLPVDERTGRQSHNGQAPQQSGWFWKPADVKGEHWQPTCSHADAPVVPATVLDPFAGSGMSLLVARQLGRHAVGLDLSFAYLHNQARHRLQLDALDAWNNGKPAKAGVDDLPLFSQETS